MLNSCGDAVDSLESRLAKNFDLERVVDVFIEIYPNCRVVVKYIVYCRIMDDWSL